MPSTTLAESAKLSQDMLIAGIIENIVVVDRFFEILPFQDIEGNALAYNRENVMGDVEFVDVGSNISAKNPATWTQVTSSLTTLIGDAEVNGLIQATRSNINDQKAAQVASKAKNIGMTYRDKLINGTGVAPEFDGLLNLVAPGQTIGAGNSAANGAPLSFEDMDNLIDLVIDKNGIVDYMMMNSRTIRSFYTLLRALGGASINETVTLPSGAQVPAYRGVPIFRNDNIPVDQTTGATNTTTTVLAGTVDDGSMSVGIAGITAMGDAGIRIAEIGDLEDRDESLTRIKFYCGLANFSELGLAALTGVDN